MKNFAILGASALMAGVALAGFAQCVSYDEVNGVEILSAEDICGEIVENYPTNGMFFSTANVVEEYEYDDAYCIVYDDVDAGLENVEICVDDETYELIMTVTGSDCVLTGYLIYNAALSRPYENLEVFTYITEESVENSIY